MLIQKKMYAGSLLLIVFSLLVLTVIMQWVITPIIKNEAISAAKLQAKVIGDHLLRI